MPLARPAFDGRCRESATVRPRRTGRPSSTAGRVERGADGASASAAASTRLPTVPEFVSGLRRHGSRTAVVTEDGELTYRELADRVDDVAARLAGPRRLVLVEASNTVPALVGYLGVLRAGHVALLAPAGDAATVDALVRSWDPDLVVEAGEVSARRGGSRHELHPDLALLMATSGSTGSPRLVRLASTSLDANAEAVADYLDIRPTDRAATTLPLHYCYGLSVVHSNLLRGAALLLDDRSVTDPGFWATFRRAGGSSIHGVPHTFELLERVGFAAMSLPQLRYVTQAGGRMGPEQVRRWAGLGRERGWDLFVMYGQTEATARMAYLPADLAARAPEAIGVAVAGGALEVADADRDGVGELVYRGPNVMLGYATTRADLAEGRTVEALRTGDLGRRRDDGLYEIVGRRSRFVKPFGVRVDLDALEELLAAHGVTAAVGGSDAAIVVAAQLDTAPTGGDLALASADHALAATARELVATRLSLPDAAVTVVVVGELPRRPNGKLDHPAVLALAPGRADHVDAEGDGPTVLGRLRALVGAQAASAEARSVREVFARTFPGRALADDASFVDLGGDSLTYVQVSSDIERALGHLPDAWDRIPLGELASALAPALTPAPAPVPTGAGSGSGRRWRGARAAGRARWATLESVVVLRALAIVLVVGEHVRLWSWLGGAHLLLAVAGWTFARFLLPDPGRAAKDPGRTRGRAEGVAGRSISRRILRSAALVAVPSSLWIAFRACTQDNVHFADALLAGSLFHPLVQGYWFVDSLVQILLLMAGVFAVPVVRRLERRSAFGVAATALVIALAARLLPSYDDSVLADIYSTHRVLWLFVLGWMLHRARTWPQKGVTAVAILVLVPQFFGSEFVRAGIVAGGLLVLMLLPRIMLPRRLAGPLTTIAASSLGIYLTHFALLPLLAHGFPAEVMVPVDLLVGVAAWWIVTEGLRRGVRVLSTRRGHGAAGPGVALERAAPRVVAGAGVGASAPAGDPQGTR